MILGIKSGAVLQRGKDGTCEIYIYACGKDIKTTLGNIEKCGEKWKLTGIKTGGPYTFTISSDAESVELKEIYVGDLWLLGGQSNMEGAGVITERDEYYRTHTNDKIRAFFMENEWGAAVPLLHRLWKSKDVFIKDFWTGSRKGSAWDEYDKKSGNDFPYEKFRGVGPGFAFLLKMYEITGVPQGAIPCGIGGTCMPQWDPEAEEDNCFAAMIRRLKECGGNARGLYWDQGEGECFPEGIDKYYDRMSKLVDSVRKENAGELSVVFDQIAYNELWNEDRDNNRFWSAIREKQRLLSAVIKNSDTVSTINAGLSDLIHKDSDSQYEIGFSAAISMAYLCGYGGKPSIRFKGFKIVTNDTVPFRYDLDVYFENVSGTLKSFGVPRGFTIQLNGEESWFYPYKHIQNVEPMGEKVRVRNELSYDELLNADIWYGIGNNCVCTVSDAEGRYLPAFGPIKVKEYLIK